MKVVGEDRVVMGEVGRVVGEDGVKSKENVNKDSMHNVNRDSTHVSIKRACDRDLSTLPIHPACKRHSLARWGGKEGSLNAI